ncbi:hypothetical protein U91I_02787 [alpha proteobacterium U9-1i]|nr:hypothetical protein U91I_02787 [alpha proteobacterium U9-1i]
MPVLTPHFSLIDDEDREFELDELDALSFRRSGVLVHPKTGLLLDEPDKHIVPFFAVSDGFLKLRETA